MTVLMRTGKHYRDIDCTLIFLIVICLAKQSSIFRNNVHKVFEIEWIEI